MPMEDYQYDNDELEAENTAENVQQQVEPGPEVSRPEVDDQYEDHNFSDENDSDDYENGPRGLGGHYYTGCPKKNSPLACCYSGANGLFFWDTLYIL